MLSPVAPPHFSEKPAGGSMKWKHPRLFFTKRYGRRERKGAGVGEGVTHLTAISIPCVSVKHHYTIAEQMIAGGMGLRRS